MKVSSFLIGTPVVVVLLLSMSFQYCQGIFHGGGTVAKLTSGFKSPRTIEDSKYDQDGKLGHLLATTPVKEGVAALIGALAGVTATLAFRNIQNMASTSIQQHYQRHHNMEKYCQQQKRAQQRSDALISLSKLAFAGFSVLLVVKQEFREQFQRYLLNTNDTVFIPLRDFLVATWHRVGPILIVALEWVVMVGGATMKMVGSVGLVALVGALVAAILIAKPTLEDIGKDLRDDLQQSYRRHRQMHLQEQGRMW